MKRISLLLATAAVILGMMSCDKLKEPYIIESIVVKGDTIPLTADDTINFDGKVVVLLEDYTGVKCTNCPAAAAITLQLQEQNEGHLVVLGVHPNNPGNSSVQNPLGGFPDFRTDNGKIWNDYFNISHYPQGLVNRMGNPLEASQWTTAVTDIIGADAPIRLIVKTDFDNATRELNVTIHSKFLRDVESTDITLITCIMEDNIIGKQITPTGTVDDYVHRHVFRGTADGKEWGQKMNDEENFILAGTNIIKTMKFTLNDEYNANEVYIVAFITDNTTKEVLMAAETKIK